MSMDSHEEKNPLHFAVQDGDLEPVRHEPSIGNMPLAEVAGNCSFLIAKLLVDSGADPTIPGWMQLNAVHRAEKRKRGDGPQVYELLLLASRKRQS